MTLRGSMVALVTPFKNGKLDLKALEKLVEFQIKNGTKALVPCGTTGESATLTHREHALVVECVVKTARKRVPVIAGTGSNSTEEAIALSKYAKKARADAALVITPYYNKPTQEGLYQHFSEIAKAVALPIILYNVPGRTSINLLPETVARISKIKNIVAIKEATGNLDQITKITTLSDITIISGDDMTTLPILSIGGTGVISVLANIVPDKVQAMIDAWERGQIHLAQNINQELYPLAKALFWESNPIPVKTALSMMRKCRSETRMPLTNMDDKLKMKLKKLLAEYKLV